MPIYLSFFQNKSIVIHYTLLYALFHQRLFPKCLLGCLRRQVAHTVCPKMSWLMSHRREWKHRIPPSTFQSTDRLDFTQLIATVDERFCSIVNSPSLEHSTSSPVWGQQARPNKTLHLQIIDFFCWPPTLAVGQFSAQINHFHPCFQGFLWNTGSEDY